MNPQQHEPTPNSGAVLGGGRGLGGGVRCHGFVLVLVLVLVFVRKFGAALSGEGAMDPADRVGWRRAEARRGAGSWLAGRGVTYETPIGGKLGWVARRVERLEGAIPTVGEALTAFRRARGIDDAGDTADTFVVPLGPLRAVFPNPGKLRLHDLHHVLTGYDTSVLGEAQVSCLELRGGGVTPLIGLLCVGAIGIGLLMAPGTIVAAWRRAAGVRSVYVLDVPEDELMAWPLERLRAELRIP